VKLQNQVAIDITSLQSTILSEVTKIMKGKTGGASNPLNLDGLFVTDSGKSIDINKINKHLNFLSMEVLKLKKESMNYNLHAKQTQKTV
jgi:hypothetical protein